MQTDSWIRADLLGEEALQEGHAIGGTLGVCTQGWSRREVGQRQRELEGIPAEAEAEAEAGLCCREEAVKTCLSCLTGRCAQEASGGHAGMTHSLQKPQRLRFTMLPACAFHDVLLGCEAVRTVYVNSGDRLMVL